MRATHQQTKRGHSSRARTLLSVFTGAGGLDLGLELAGFQIIGCLEIDDNARQTLRVNKPDWRILEPHDVLKVAPKKLQQRVGLRRRELDILAGGPPCQPFSKAAQWSSKIIRGMKDPRSKCIVAFCHLARQLLPRVILIENVPGFVRGSNSAIPFLKRYFTAVNRENNTRYRIEYRILDAADYGVPQRRVRAIIVILREGQKFNWPQPTHKGSYVRAWDALANLKEDGEELPTAEGKWADLLPSIPEGRNYLWHTDAGGGIHLFGRRTRYWSFLLKLSKSEPSWTIPAQPGPATGPFHWSNRPLTVNEILKLQSFPSGWKVWGEHRQQVRQIGNATPPLLMEIIGRALLAQVFGYRPDGFPRLLIQRRLRVSRRASTGAVPRKYRVLEGNHRAHPGAGKGPKPTKITKPQVRTRRA